MSIRRPRNLQVMSEYGEPLGEEVETEEEYNTLFGITEDNPLGVGIDEYSGKKSPSRLALESGQGGYGKKRVGEQSRKQMNLTSGRNRSSILTS